MSALTAAIDAAKAEGRAALIGYLPSGFPDAETSHRALRAIIEAGVDIVEIGPPYTDPVLDGPVIQQATAAALERGVTMDDTYAAVSVVRDAGAVPVVMSYYNLMLQRGLDVFARELVDAGAAGVIAPDVTPDAAPEWVEAANAAGLDHVYLVAPSTTTERLALTAQASSGFVYAASLMGVTGERASVGDAAERLVADVRAAGAERVCVGLGVSTGDHAAQVARYADGVIVGTALVKCLFDQDRDAAIEAIAEKARELRRGVEGHVEAHA